MARFWVHDYGTEEWIPAGEAVYVSGNELHTPMGFGVVAFSNPQRAQDFAAGSSAMVMSFEALMDKYMQGESSHGHSDS